VCDPWIKRPARTRFNLNFFFDGAQRTCKYFCFLRLIPAVSRRMNRNISARRGVAAAFAFSARFRRESRGHACLSRACTQPCCETLILHNTRRLPVVDTRLGRWQRDNSHLPNLWRYRATTGVVDPFKNRRGCPRNWSHPERHVAAKKRRGGCTPRMGHISEYATCVCRNK